MWHRDHEGLPTVMLTRHTISLRIAIMIYPGRCDPAVAALCACWLETVANARARDVWLVHAGVAYLVGKVVYMCMTSMYDLYLHHPCQSNMPMPINSRCCPAPSSRMILDNRARTEQAIIQSSQHTDRGMYAHQSSQLKMTLMMTHLCWPS